MNLRIRLSNPHDELALRRLAILDSQTWAGGEALVAEVDGELRAALPLDGSPPTADPFRHTADLLDLLELRRSQLRRPRKPPRRAGRRLLRSPARA